MAALSRASYATRSHESGDDLLGLQPSWDSFRHDDTSIDTIITDHQGKNAFAAEGYTISLYLRAFLSLW
jgi:hypothetical protein